METNKLLFDYFQTQKFVENNLFIEKEYNESDLYSINHENKVSRDIDNYLKNIFQINNKMEILSVINLLSKWFKIRIFVTQKICGEFGFVIFIQSDNPASNPFERISTFTYSSKTYNQALNDGIKYVIKNKILQKQIEKMIITNKNL